MADFDMQRIEVKLNDDKEMLAQHRLGKKMFKDAEGKEYFEAMFDGRPFVFYPGRVYDLPATIARGIRRDTRVVLGKGDDRLTNPYSDTLIFINEYDGTIGKPVRDVIPAAELPVNSAVSKKAPRVEATAA